MIFHRIKDPINFTYKLNNVDIKSCETVTDLGVVFDHEIRFHLHINNVASRASSTLGFVKRWSKEFNSPTVTRHLYISLVRPILEYACQVWTPYYQNGSERVEKVQKRFVRFALSSLPWNDPIALPPYTNRLELLDLHPLYKRREVADLVFLHGLLNFNISCPFLYDKITFNTNRYVLRTNAIFTLPFCRFNYAKHEATVRMCNLANNSTPNFRLDITKLCLKKNLYNN